MGKQESPSQNNNATPNHNAEILERGDIYHPSIDQRTLRVRSERC
ncbi:MAG TPA: hypothetical protein VJ729_14760 [Nitrososphaeraceae archaeon]|jgi:hypothetical protein|nr:hypothetical protein [Nitrososphaeraceae archaeon]